MCDAAPILRDSDPTRKPDEPDFFTSGVCQKLFTTTSSNCQHAVGAWQHLPLQPGVDMPDSNNGGAPDADPTELLQVAQYVRMSTEHQRYSTENQAEAISDYAASHGMQIVRTYRDDGKSGLNLGGREGLRKLLSDVRQGACDFSAVLVYDVSRWGRFRIQTRPLSMSTRVGSMVSA
ncbi:recombinase family protein [Cupriavidus basilensis]